MKGDAKSYLTHLDTLEEIDRPTEFNYPFFYQSTPLAERAARDLKSRLSDIDFNNHVFEAKSNGEAERGKMFGVLVVEDSEGKLGYLSAFSGKIGDSNHFKGFVPPVYDLLSNESFFTQEYAVVSKLIKEVQNLEKDEQYLATKAKLKNLSEVYKREILLLKQEAKNNKLSRNKIRIEAKSTSTEPEYSKLEQDLAQQSIREKLEIKHKQKSFKEELDVLESKCTEFENRLSKLKEERARESNALQNKIFDHYKFLNARGEFASLLDIFKDTELNHPPAGAGECSAPKLLHFAYQNSLKPIAMVEFWWGASPKSEVRKHGNYYPACRSKCFPILTHMMKGLKVEENPLIATPSLDKKIEIIHEEETFVVLNKPAGLLSVPGKVLKDSVQLRMEELFPFAKDHLIVHRLDMATSGLMIIAKEKNTHKHLQSQFAKRKVEKRYVALLDGILKREEGEVELPLRLDIEDRPRQIVCFDHGKPAFTRYEVIERRKGKTKVYFYPKTGRTHQLRVHAAHSLGLNLPIVGDDLYGQPASRLHLHAERIELYHPVSNERVVYSAKCEF